MHGAGGSVVARDCPGRRDDLFGWNPHGPAVSPGPTAVVMAHRDPAELLADALRGLAASDPAPDVIRVGLDVSDNGGDGYHFGDPRITVLDSCEVTSAAYARNRAIPHATGDLLCFLDDDDELQRDYLESMVRVFDERPAVQMVKCHMMRRGERNETYGTPTVMVRRSLAAPDWQPIHRQDRGYYQAIIERHSLSVEAGTLVVIPQVLCRSGADANGGLRESSF